MRAEIRFLVPSRMHRTKVECKQWDLGNRAHGVSCPRCFPDTLGSFPYPRQSGMKLPHMGRIQRTSDVNGFLL